MSKQEFEKYTFELYKLEDQEVNSIYTRGSILVAAFVLVLNILLGNTCASWLTAFHRIDVWIYYISLLSCSATLATSCVFVGRALLPRYKYHSTVRPSVALDRLDQNNSSSTDEVSKRNTQAIDYQILWDDIQHDLRLAIDKNRAETEQRRKLIKKSFVFLFISIASLGVMMVSKSLITVIGV